jgi:hypothetical protein
MSFGFCIASNLVNNKNELISTKYLTNDSIKFWQTYPPIQKMCLGLYFSKDGTCDEYNIDDNHNRMFRYYYDVIINKPLLFKINKDSLKIYDGDCLLERCCFHRYKILKLSSDSLIIQKTDRYLSDSTFQEENIIYHYFPSKDQHTKPKFWYELYPHDQSRWPYGTY